MILYGFRINFPKFEVKEKGNIRDEFILSVLESSAFASSARDLAVTLTGLSPAREVTPVTLSPDTD